MKRDTQNNSPGPHHLQSCDGSDISPGSTGILPALHFLDPFPVPHTMTKRDQHPSFQTTTTKAREAPCKPTLTQCIWKRNRPCPKRCCQQNSHAGHVLAMVAPVAPTISPHHYSPQQNHMPAVRWSIFVKITLSFAAASSSLEEFELNKLDLIAELQ